MPKYPFTLFILTLILGLVLVSNVALSEDKYGLEGVAGKAGLKDTAKGSLTDIVGNVIGTALSMVGVLFFGLMIYGGILWMTDRGNEEHSKKALETIKAAVIGIIIVLASYAITSFVFEKVGGVGGGTLDLSNSDQGCTNRGAQYRCLGRSECKDGTAQSNLCLAPGHKSDTNIVCCEQK